MRFIARKEKLVCMLLTAILSTLGPRLSRAKCAVIEVSFGY